MGKPETVVNSAWRSGFFSSVGRSVFSSQAFSFAEGLRCGDVGSVGVAVCVDALEGSLMIKLLPSLRPLLLCYAKDSSRASARAIRAPGNSVDSRVPIFGRRPL